MNKKRINQLDFIFCSLENMIDLRPFIHGFFTHPTLVLVFGIRDACNICMHMAFNPGSQDKRGENNHLFHMQRMECELCQS